MDAFKFWWASDLARLLGYTTLDAFRKAVNKALIACDALGIPIMDNFLQERRMVDGRSQVDFKLSRFACMGKEELAANLFRITQTEAKIRKERRRGQHSLEDAAEEVGRRVRRTMEEISGNRPEELRPTEDIKVVRKKLKSTQREFRKLDGKAGKPPATP